MKIFIAHLQSRIIVILLVLMSLIFSSCSNRDQIIISDEKSVHIDSLKPHLNENLINKIIKVELSAIDWFKNNFRDKGIWVYDYYPEENRHTRKNNEIRQLMTSRYFAELAHQTDEYANIHKENLDFIFKHWYKEKENIAYVEYLNKSKLGGNAMFLRTLIASPFFQQYQEQAEKIAKGIVYLINDDGSFDPWLVEPNYEYDKDYLLTFYSGEALLALVEYYLKTNDIFYLNKAISTQDFYINRYVDNLKDYYYPAYVPWHTLSMNNLYKITGNQKYAQAIFVLNDELLKIQDLKNDKGRFYNPQFKQYGSPHTSSDGVYTEGLIYAYEVALLSDNQKYQEKYWSAIELSLNHLLDLQYSDSNMLIDKQFSLGAFDCGLKMPYIRIDCTQHFIDALTKLKTIYNDYK